MKIDRNKCSIFIDGATIDYNQLKQQLTENVILCNPKKTNRICKNYF